MMGKPSLEEHNQGCKKSIQIGKTKKKTIHTTIKCRRNLFRLERENEERQNAQGCKNFFQRRKKTK